MLADLLMDAFLLGIPLLSFFFFRRGEHPFKAFGLQHFKASYLVQGVYLFLAVLALSILFSFYADSIGAHDLENVTAIASALKLDLARIVYLFAVRIFAEEFFFRGFLVGVLEKAFGFLKKNAVFPAILLSSALFGLVHASYHSFVQIAGTFLLGVLLAVSYTQQRSLYVPWIAHFLYNAFVFVVLL